MEIQNYREIDNNMVIGNDHNEHNDALVPDKLAYICDCGCGLSFLHGEHLGFKINVVGEDAILIEDQMKNEWSVYIPIALIGTWGEFMDLIASSRRDLPNDKVWYHLDVYLHKRHEIADDTTIEFVYMN
jgi:hypothetical protein